jgi:hypothetical protein
VSLAGSYRGLTFGNGTTSGFHVGGVEGLWDLPDVRSDDLPKAVGDGVFPGTPKLGPRRIVLTLHLIAATPVAYEALVQTLIAETDDVVTLDTLSLMGNTVTVEARPTRRIIPVKTGEQQRTGTAVINFICPDPTVT